MTRLFDNFLLVFVTSVYFPLDCVEPCVMKFSQYADLRLNLLYELYDNVVFASMLSDTICRNIDFIFYIVLLAN